MSKFKVGDRVRRTGVTRDEVVEGEEYIVRMSNGVGEVYLKGKSLSYFEDYFELVAPVEPTDAELAAEYRELRKRAALIHQTLMSRGYTHTSRYYSGREWFKPIFYPDQEFRFTKTITTTEEV